MSLYGRILPGALRRRISVAVGAPSGIRQAFRTILDSLADSGAILWS